MTRNMVAGSGAPDSQLKYRPFLALSHNAGWCEMSEKTEKVCRYRLSAVKLRAMAAEDVTRENCDLLLQVADDFEQMTGDLEAIGQLGR